MQGFHPNTLKCHKLYYCSRCLVTVCPGQEHNYPTIHDTLRLPSHDTHMSRVLRAAPLMLSEQSNILTSTKKPTTSKADPSTEAIVILTKGGLGLCC